MILSTFQIEIQINFNFRTIRTVRGVRGVRTVRFKSLLFFTASIEYRGFESDEFATGPV